MEVRRFLELRFLYHVSGVHLLHRDGLFYLSVNELEHSAGNIEDYLASNFHFVTREIWYEATEIE